MEQALPFHSIQTKNTQAGLVSFIENAMRQTGSIGLSLAIVEDGTLIYQKGFGTKSLNSKEKVTPETMMMIGSTTKPLTALFIATLIDEGYLHWQNKVQAFYPEFKLKDKTLTQSLTLAQLLNAASGMPRKDLTFFLNDEGKTAEDLLAKIANFAPNQTDREITFQYNNHMVSLAGYLAGKKAHPELPLKEAYIQSMEEKVFSPLRMTRTTFSHDKALSDPNHALPHGQDIRGFVRAIPPENERCMGYLAPSGGAWSTVTDLAQFMLTELNDGITPNGSLLASIENIHYRRNPQIAVSENEDYGLCWFIQNMYGLKRIHHAGRSMGFSSFFSFFPARKSGIVMLSNSVHDVVLQEVIHQKLCELWFGLPEEAEQKLALALAEQEKQIAQSQSEKRDPAFLAQFIGTYKNDEIADFHIEKIKDDFILRVDSFTTPLGNKTNMDGKKVLVGLLPPWTWMGLELVPDKEDGSSFALSLRDECYIFHRGS